MLISGNSRYGNWQLLQENRVLFCFVLFCFVLFYNAFFQLKIDSSLKEYMWITVYPPSTPPS